MRNKKDTKIRNKKIFLIVMVLIVSVWTFTNIFYVFNLMEYIKELESMKEKEETSNTTIQENTLTKEEIEENTNELEIADLKDKDERTRIQQYCGKFIRYIENKEYDKAYNLLYPDFKNNYFKTVEDFKKYAEEKFPQTLIAVEYNNIERQGQYYILFTTIKTPLNVDYSMDQKFILIENGFNDFKISFDVKQ
ncbi:MAG: hypothetical protein ACLUWN_06600 [Clostridia bacterium]|jgi:hypothetical protein